MKEKPILSLVIPFYNENVSHVLSNLTILLDKEKINYEIIAVDNGSNDGTGSVIDEFIKNNNKVKKLHIIKNKGYGFGINKGLSITNGTYIGYLWGDNQVDSSLSISVFKKLKETKSDLCKVARVMRKETLIRKIESNIYNFIMDFLFNLDSKDVNGCPKIMKSKVYKNLNIKSKDWFIDAEIMIKCNKKGYKVIEIPISSDKRKIGESKVSLFTILEFIYNIILYKLGGI